MICIHAFVFNPFQENTYILHDSTNDCIIIDPGCCDQKEQEKLSGYITEKGLNPVRLLNTHCHIDHIMGNRYVCETYSLKLEAHELEIVILEAGKGYADLYNFTYDPSPYPSVFLTVKDTIKFGDSRLEILFVPGHSPGHIAFVGKDQKFVIGGDVLFLGSIGRTDLPGGDHSTLISSIKTQFLPLGDDFEVFTGHGPSTTIAHEKSSNPFLRDS
jgi:hydroxyacylglutathione hydrolase